METMDIRLRIIKDNRLFEECGGFSQKLGENSFRVVINGNDDADGQALTFLHEMLHIWHKDFNSVGDVRRIEGERRQELLRLLQKAAEEEDY